MCLKCNYPHMLETVGLEATPNRLRVLEIIGNHSSPLQAGEIYAAILRSSGINRVTVYRILDLLVARGLVDKMSGAERTFHFGLAPNENHHPHPHFFCRRCKHLECLTPDSLPVDMGPLAKTFPGRIENVEVRVDGICKDCLRRSS